MSLPDKSDRLIAYLQDRPRMMVAYSGGVDSGFLLWFCIHQAGIDAVGVLADSPSLKRSELEEARSFARHHALPLDIIQTSELQDPRYQSNPVNRCFYCKHELFARMEERAREAGFPCLAYGENADDVGQHRPGRDAAHQFEVLAPLQACGFHKADIRRLASEAGLPIADKVAQPCLASRLPTGVTVDRTKLERVEAAEAFISHLGFRIVRVRHLDDRARVLVGRSETPALLKPESRDLIEKELIRLGFPLVEFCEQGYQGPSEL